MSPLEEKFALEGLDVCERRSATAMDQALHLLDLCEELSQCIEQESDLRARMEASLFRMYAELGRINFAAGRGKPSDS
jgi:hypothetical protein